MSFARASPTSSMTPSASSSSTATITPTLGSARTGPGSGGGLRVNTDSRLRSNSAASPRPSPTAMSASASGGIGGPYTYQHHSSRSLSSASQQPSPSPVSPNNHVALAVRGLRGGSPPPQRDRLWTTPTNGNGIGIGNSASGTSATTPTSASTSTSASDSEDDIVLRLIQTANTDSNDNGDTIDISRHDIRRIGHEAVDTLRTNVGSGKKGVWRLALSYNALRDGSLVDSFSRLNRLRYLNLKGNYLTHFPKVLLEMPAMEILDLSKNRITAFPEEPGRLTRLKVLSLTHNKIYTLPSYLVDFPVLKVFKVDKNPIQWPPLEVLGILAITEEATAQENGSTKTKNTEDLRPWIENMKSWMRQKSAESDQMLERSLQQDKGYSLSSDMPPYSASSDAPPVVPPWQRDMPKLAVSSLQTVKPVLQPLRDESDSPIGQIRPQISTRAMSTPFKHDSPGRAASPVARLQSSVSRHERNPSTLSYNSPLSASTESSAHSRNPSNNLPPPVMMQQGHSRGASYTATQRMGANLTAKKSLPDLRQSHAKIISDRRNDGQAAEEVRTLGLGIAAPTVSTFKLPGRGSWGADMIKSPTGPTFSPLDRGKVLGRKGSVDMLRRTSGEINGDMSEKRSSQEGPLIDESRNSYFRRLSTLPVSTISKAIPPGLLKFIDAIRGILFALSQLHSALRQYLVFAVNDRIASVFSRVMEPASNYMNTLINALDRFDSMSRRHTPPVHTIRGVLDATRENVAVFAKVVAVLRLQVPALKGNDVRYTRTLLLMIYGSMAEVACSWQNMAPLLAEIKPLLADGGSIAMRAVMGGQKMVPTGSLTGRTPISPIIERRESHSPPSVTKSLVGNSPLSQVVDQVSTPLPIGGGSNPSWAAGRTRRQAGSFSSQDVERGMLMGSPGVPRSGEIPMMGEAGPASYLRHRPSESATIVLENQEEEPEPEVKEVMATPAPPVPISTISPNGTPTTVPTTPPEVLPPPQLIAMVPTTSQSSRRGHQPSSSSGSSHALSLSTSIHPPPSRKLSVDVRPPTPASATLFDEDLLDVIETATDIAFTCWLKLAEDVGASTPPFISIPTHAKTSSQGSTFSNLESTRSIPPLTPIDNPRRPPTISAKHHTELLHLLSVAEQITAALRESLMGLRANPMAYPTTTLPDDAQAFIKTVVRVSELVKIISANHTFPINVRQNCSRLTQATRECAILIQVSSLRPGNVTPAPIPSSARSISPFHRSRTSNAEPGSSTEDLSSQPQSATYYSNPNSATNGYHVPVSAGWEYQPPPPSQPREGLRGLQLPSRQMALGRSRSANAVPTPPTMSAGDGRRMDGYGQQPPRSAEPGQVAF